MIDKALSQARDRMQKTTQFLRSEINRIRTSRATPALVENIKIEAYGGSTELKISELGTISTQDSKTIIIQPFDASIIGEIKKGIQKSNIGLNPVIDNQVIRITLPPLSDERRKEFVKLLRQKSEAARIAIRNIRRDFIDQIEQAEEKGEISEDDKFRLQEEIQKFTDEFNGEIAQMTRIKEQELMKV